MAEAEAGLLRYARTHQMVPALPGMMQSHFMMFCVPSAALCGLATKPCRDAHLRGETHRWRQREKGCAHMRVVLTPGLALLLEASSSNAHREWRECGSAGAVLGKRRAEVGGWGNPGALGMFGYLR